MCWWIWTKLSTGDHRDSKTEWEKGQIKTIQADFKGRGMLWEAKDIFAERRLWLSVTGQIPEKEKWRSRETEREQTEKT